MSPAVSLDEVVVISTPVLVLGSKLLGQVSSVRCVACPKKHSIDLGFSCSLKKLFALVEPKQRTLTLGVWQGNARKALCV